MVRALALRSGDPVFQDSLESSGKVQLPQRLPCQNPKKEIAAYKCETDVKVYVTETT